MSTNRSDCAVTDNKAFSLAYAAISICCLVTCESVMTIVTILRSNVLSENHYLFVQSLALMDILLTVASTTATCINLPVIRPHIRINMIETVTFGAHSASITVTGIHMAIIAIDRYIRIAHPFHYIQKMTRNFVIKILLAAWILWTVIACLPLAVSSFINYWTCIYRHPPLEYYFTNLGITVVSVMIVFVCYFKIALLAVRHKKAIIARRHQNEANRDATVVRSNNIIMKSIKFCVIMFGSYFVCTFIPFIFVSISLFLYISDLFKFIFSYLLTFHSVLNFFICCRMDKQFRRALQNKVEDLLKICRLCCQRNHT